MFAKFFIFALVGTYLVLASPVETDSIERSEFSNKLSEWWTSVRESFKAYFEKSKQSFGELVDDLKKESKVAIELGKEKAAELKEKYEVLSEKAKKQLEEQKKIWEVRIQEALKRGKQQYEKVKEESKKTLSQLYKKWQAKYEEIKQKVKEALEKEKEAIENKKKEEAAKLQ